MKVISDIRIYKSKVENIEGNSLPSEFKATKILNAKIKRIVMALRENNFSFGDFDHLYINFTIYNVDNEISQAKREIDKYHPWFRYYDVHVSEEMYKNTDEDFVISIIQKILTENFSSNSFPKEKINQIINNTLKMQSSYEMKYKEKLSANRKAILFLRYNDNCLFVPAVKIYDSDNKLILEKELPKTNNLDSFGSLILSNSKLTIKPKRNSCENLKDNYIIIT